MIEKRLLSSKDVARILGVSRKSALQTMRSMRHINVGLGTKNQILRVMEETLEEYIRNRDDPPISKSRKANLK